MSYLLLPDLVAILWMAVVLSHLRSRHTTDFLHLWISGLALIVIEGIARILYSMPMSVTAHNIVHIIALDGYYLAGVAFFQSATGQLRYLRNSNPYLLLCILPNVALITLYGAGFTSRPLFLGIGLIGLIASLSAAILFRRPTIHIFCHLVLWLPALMASFRGDFRSVTYLLLFNAYAATAIAFSFTLPRERWGRAVVIAGFALWSICFVTHPWIAGHHASWVPMAAKIWDLQKFLVTFGLLIVTLEEDSAAKEHEALHDILTGLPNRRLFHDRIEQAVAHSKRKYSRIVLFNIDLDNFKEVNDRWGHDAGDALLQEIAIRLASVTRQIDTLARMGGDEFNLLIHDFLPAADNTRGSNAADVLGRCLAVMESFRHAVERAPFEYQVDGTTVQIQPFLSIGSAIYPDQADTLDAFCRLADQNMYADKRRRASEASNDSAGPHNTIHLAPALTTKLASTTAS